MSETPPIDPRLRCIRGEVTTHQLLVHSVKALTFTPEWRSTEIASRTASSGQ